MLCLKKYLLIAVLFSLFQIFFNLPTIIWHGKGKYWKKIITYSGSLHAVVLWNSCLAVIHVTHFVFSDLFALMIYLGFSVIVCRQRHSAVGRGEDGGWKKSINVVLSLEALESLMDLSKETGHFRSTKSFSEWIWVLWGAFRQITFSSPFSRYSTSSQKKHNWEKDQIHIKICFTYREKVSVMLI